MKRHTDHRSTWQAFWRWEEYPERTHTGEHAHSAQKDPDIPAAVNSKITRHILFLSSSIFSSGVVLDTLSGS